MKFKISDDTMISGMEKITMGACYSVKLKLGFRDKEKDPQNAVEERKDYMKCNYVEYHRLTDQMFYGVAQTDTHLNQYTEILRQYLINGGAANMMLKLGVGIQLITKRPMLLPEEVVMRRFIWLKGNRKGELLEKHEIEALGMFLPGGALCEKEDNYIWD